MSLHADPLGDKFRKLLKEGMIAEASKRMLADIPVQELESLLNRMEQLPEVRKRLGRWALGPMKNSPKTLNKPKILKQTKQRKAGGIRYEFCFLFERKKSDVGGWMDGGEPGGPLDRELKSFFKKHIADVVVLSLGGALGEYTWIGLQNRPPKDPYYALMESEIKSGEWKNDSELEESSPQNGPKTAGGFDKIQRLAKEWLDDVTKYGDPKHDAAYYQPLVDLGVLVPGSEVGDDDPSALPVVLTSHKATQKLKTVNPKVYGIAKWLEREVG